MPFRAPRICGCGRIVPAGQLCQCQQQRARERKARFDRTRPNSSQRGYDRQWEQAAKAFLAEPGNERCRCGAPAVLVAHIISIRKRPDLRMVRANWRPSCARCNNLDAIADRPSP
jgi:5-methylcytosine-specific restriction endonuclease McrA